MTILRYFYVSLLGIISTEAFLSINSFSTWNHAHIESYTKAKLAVTEVNKEKNGRDLGIFQIENVRMNGRRKRRRNKNLEELSFFVQKGSNFDTGNRPNTAFRRGRWRKFRVGQLRRFRDRAIFSNPDSVEELAVVNEDSQSDVNEKKRIFPGFNQRKTNSKVDSNEDENQVFQKKDSIVTINESIGEMTLNEKKNNSFDNEVLKDNLKNDIVEKKKEGRRVEFKAKEKSSRIISLDDKSCALFLEYMRQPVEDYSLRSFSEPTNKNISGRRWLVRRLTKDESSRYLSPGKTYKDNFFRIGAPLKPLLGLDLTPVIDMEVTPSFVSDSYKSDIMKKDDKKSIQLGSRWRKRISTAMARDAAKSNKDTIKIRSTRVDLLSTVKEISYAMNNKGPLSDKTSSISSENIMQPVATAVSSDRNIQEFGYEAIGFFGKLDKNIHPHLEFDTTISWSSQESFNKKPSNLIKMKITVETSLLVSLTIPPIPLPVPIPTSLAVQQIGSLLTDQVLRLVQPKFLNQIDRDFKRWSSSPTVINDQIEMETTSNK